MLSPIPQVIEDVITHHTGFHHNAVERLIKKLCAPSTNFTTDKERDLVVGDLLNTFWTEHECFHSKSGPFANREHIWNSKDIVGMIH